MRNLAHWLYVFILMKNIKLFILLQLVSYQFANSQSTCTFNKSVHSFNSSDVSNSACLQNLDSGFVVNFGSIEFNVYHGELNFIKLDKYGEEVFRKTINDSLYAFWALGLKTFSTGGYISSCVRFARSLPDYSKSLLVRYNEFGDSLWTREDSIIKYSYYTDILEIPNFKIAAIGAGSDTIINGFSSRQNGFIAIYDSVGNKIHSQVYTLPNGDDLFDAFVPTPDNGFLIAGRSFIGVNPNTTCRAWLVKTDSTGAFQFQKIWSAIGDGIAIVSICPLSDGNYLVAGGTAINANTYDNVAFLRKIDVSGNIIWTKTYEGLTPGPKSFFNCKELSDKTILACGNSYNVNPNDDSGYILKADSLGNVIWERELNPDINEDYFLRLNTTYDGGIILNGTSINFANDSTQDVWIVKLDSLGCDSMGCAFYTGIHESNSPGIQLLEIYPNPSSTILNISFQSNSDFVDAYFQLVDITGKVILKRSLDSKNVELSVSNIENGIYFVILNDNTSALAKKILIQH